MDRNLRIQLLLQAIDNVTAPLRDIAQGSGQASQAVNQTREKLRQLNAASAQLTAFKTLKGDLAATKTEMDAARQRATQLGRELANTANPTKKLQQDFDRARRAAAQLEAQHQTQTLRLRDLRTQMSQAGISTTGLAQQERDLRRQISETNTELAERTRRLAAVTERQNRIDTARSGFDRTQQTAGNIAAGGATAVATGVAALAPVAMATKGAMALEEKMADVKKVVDFDSPKQFKQMQQDLMALSETIPYSTAELAELAAAGGQSGIAREELLQFAQDAGKMGIAFDKPASEAGEMMAQWRSAFGMGREEVIALADQVNHLGNTTSAGTEAISDIVTRIGPLGDVGGVAAASVAALGATMASVGTAPEIAATGIKNMILAMTKGEAATKGQEKVWQSLGLTATGVAKAMQQDSNAAILDVMQRMQKLPKEAQAATLTQLFGSESVSAIAPLLTQLDTVKANLDQVGHASKYAGSMQAEFASRSSTTANQVTLANNAANNLKDTIGGELLEDVKAMADRLKTLAQGVRNWAQENPGVSKTLLLIAAVVGGLLVVFGGLAIALAGLMAPFAAVTFMAGALGISLLPVLLIAAKVALAVAAVAAVVWLLSQAWEMAAPYVTSAIDSIGQKINQFASWVAGLGAKFGQFGMDIVRGLWAGISSAGPWLLGKMQALVQQLPQVVKSALGIKSPSRVFMGLGGHIVDGLDAGIAGNAQAPVNRVSALSGQLAAAFAAGAIAPAIAGPAVAGAPGAAAAPASQAVGMAAAAPSGGDTFNITITGGQGADIAEQVKRAIEQLQRERDARTFKDR